MVTEKRGRSAKTVLITCGALAREVLETCRADGLNADVVALPALLHNRPERIPEAVEKKIQQVRADYEQMLVVYGDCGTGGGLDIVLQKEKVQRINGPHCYQIYGESLFEGLMEEEPGTFFLTDYLVRSFESLVIKGLGLDRFPQLRDEYFRHYRRVVYLAQSDEPLMTEKAKQAADFLGLPLQTYIVGCKGLSRSLREGLEKS